MGFSRQEYWSELLCPPPGESFWSTDWAVSLVSCIGRRGSLPLAPPGKPLNSCTTSWNPAYAFALLWEVFLVWKIWLQFSIPVDIYWYTCFLLGFPCGSAGKESTCNVGDLSLIPGLGRSPEEEKGYPVQYSGLENSMEYTVHGVVKSQIRLSDFHFHCFILLCCAQITLFLTSHFYGDIKAHFKSRPVNLLLNKQYTCREILTPRFL